MSILAECSICKKRQSEKNKLCKCGEDLDKAKRSRKTKFYIRYRLPGGKQRQEMVGFSISEARDADSKRRVQKRENRIFDMLPESKMTFNELIDWYLNLQSVTCLSSAQRVRSALNNIRATFGDIQARNIKPKNIPINHYVAKVLNNTPRAVHHDFIFTYRGNSFSEGGIKRSFKTACINAGVPYGRKTPNGITFHDFRRTFKTSMLTAGVDKVYRDAIVGHSLKEWTPTI